MCFSRQFLSKIWPIHLAFLPSFLIVSWIFLSSGVTLLHFSHDRSNWYSSSLSRTTFQNFSGTSDLLSEECKFQHHTQPCSKCCTSLLSSLNLSPVCWWKSSSSSVMAILYLISLVHLASFVTRAPKQLEDSIFSGCFWSMLGKEQEIVLLSTTIRPALDSPTPASYWMGTGVLPRSTVVGALSLQLA